MIIELNSKLLEPYNEIAMAVSGGPDSLAMLHLMHEQAKGKKLIALTVDHKLREESKEEAHYVASICKKLEIEHYILEWNHGEIKGNMHDQARKARYELMTDFCQENEIEVLCKAQHADDRVENFFIRIYQGAGPFGLIYKDHMIYNNINIIRPLFHVRKSELIVYLKQKNVRYIEDPSNEDPKFLRSNIRKWLALMPKEKNFKPDIFVKNIVAIKDSLIGTRELSERMAEEIFEGEVLIADEGFSLLGGLDYNNKQISCLLISKVLENTCNSEGVIRLQKLETLYNRMLEGREKNTLAGCIIKLHKLDNSYFDGWIIFREFGKNPPKDTMLKNGAIWDNRYLVQTKKTHKDIRISHLNQREYSEIKKYFKYPQKLEKHLKKNKEIIFTLPVIKNLEKVIAIPHINYYDDAYGNLKNEITLEFIRKK